MQSKNMKSTFLLFPALLFSTIMLAQTVVPKIGNVNKIAAASKGITDTSIHKIGNAETAYDSTMPIDFPLPAGAKMNSKKDTQKGCKNTKRKCHLLCKKTKQ